MNCAQYLDALLSLPSVAAPQVSRDGKWVAWTWFQAGPAADVYAAPTDVSQMPVRLTDTLDDTILVSWAPDHRAVVVAQDKDGNERDQLFRVDLDRPLAMAPLTEPDPCFYIRGGELHPNGRWLVYAANVDASTGREIEPTWVYRHDLLTGERVALARPEKGAHYRPELNAPGTHVLYARQDLHPSGRQVWLVDIEGREDREILNAGPDVKTYASWFPDGLRVVALVETKTHTRVGVWRLDTGEWRWLIDDPRRNVEHAFAPFGSRHIVVVEVQQARPRCILLDPDTGEETPLPETAGNLIPLAPASDGGWAGVYYSSRQPQEMVRFEWADPRTEQFASLSRVWQRTPLARQDFAPAQEFRWRSADGMPVQGWLYRPAGEARGTIVYVHGGPTWHSEDAVNPHIQFFVRNGFNVLDPNYRGSTGFDLAFREAIKADGWGGREQDDIRAGVEALIAAGIAQPGRVGITGTSYGGYSSWCAIVHWPPELMAASAPICGMTDLVVDYQTTRPDLRPYSEEMMGGSPSQAPERYRERSPIHFVGGIQGRLLIVQGMQDPNVTPENVRAVKAALDGAGVEYQVLAFEDEGHGISRPKNRKVLYQRLLEFFESSFRDGAAG